MTASSPTNAVPDVPTVENPLAIDAFVTEPCTSLTPDQLSHWLGADNTTDPNENGATGPSCSWYSDVITDARIAVNYPQVTDEGLAALYRNRDKHDFFDELTPVDGYPAISYGDQERRDGGRCVVTVGTSDSEYISMRVDLGRDSVGETDPCDAAYEVATAVIGNIKAAN